MTDQLVSKKVAILARKKAFNKPCRWVHYMQEEQEVPSKIDSEEIFNSDIEKKIVATPTQTSLSTWIRKMRGVHIEIGRSASGYYWDMCMSDSGTNLGGSGITGPNDSGQWDEYEDALEDALELQLSMDLPENFNSIKHWSNYAHFAQKKRKKNNK